MSRHPSIGPIDWLPHLGGDFRGELRIVERRAEALGAGLGRHGLSDGHRDGAKLRNRRKLSTWRRLAISRVTLAAGKTPP